MAYEWKVYDLSEKKVEIQLNFTNALAVSQGDDQDLLSINFTDPSLFTAKATGESLSVDSVNILMSIPRQMPNNKATANMVFTATKVDSTMKIVMIAMFALQ